MRGRARAAVIVLAATLAGCTAPVSPRTDVSPGAVDNSAKAGWNCTATSCEVPADAITSND